MNIYQPRTIPPQVIGDLKNIFISNFTEYLDARIARSNTNTKFLIVQFPENDSDYSILVEISDERLQILVGGEMNLIDPFITPEKGFFYLAKFDQNNEIELLYMYLPSERDFEWPIPSNLSIDFKWLEVEQKFDLTEYAIKKGRFALEIIVEFEKFKDSTIKLSSIKRYLVPFYEMVKTALLANSLIYNSKTIEEKLNMGFSKIEFKCLHGILEFDYNRSPQLANLELESLTTLYLLLASDNEEEIFEYFKSFPDKKLIAQYISLLRKILEDKSLLKSKMATPDHFTSSFEIDRNRSRSLQKTITTKVTSVEYSESIVGVLTRLDYTTTKTHALFSLRSSSDDQVYSGTVSIEADKKLREEFVNFNSHEYECQLRITLIPESSTNDEKYKYELIDYTEIQKSEELYPNRDEKPSEDYTQS
jgi:hypothetical protein